MLGNWVVVWGVSTPTVWPDAGSLGGGLCGSPVSSVNTDVRSFL
jgi:hypothetical protein